MGQINLIHDESWRAARLVVNHLGKNLDDAELLDVFHAVREMIAESLRRILERRERELHRLAQQPAPEN